MDTEELYSELSRRGYAMKTEVNSLIMPPNDIIQELKQLIKIHGLPSKELYYHFNLGEWTVDLADTKKSMINYDIKDVINEFTVKVEKEQGETEKQRSERQKEATQQLRNKLLTLYKNFKKHVFNELKDEVESMTYDDLLKLFRDTWTNVPFELEPLLEKMALLMGNKSVMQNVVGDSGSFKSSRSMIEFNTLPNVLLMDDATLNAIARDGKTKGIEYLDDTIVYYNDVADLGQMKRNFEECMESIYKKLYSEGSVNKSVTRKNSDNTLHIKLRTPNGFKCCFNGVKPLFSQDYGQTASRIQTIQVPSISPEEVKELISKGLFGRSNKSSIDPRYFKNILEVYMKTRNFEGFSNEFENILSEIAIKDSNGTVNFHSIGSILYINEQMFKLYGKEHYKVKFFNRYIEEGSMQDKALQLYDEIWNMVGEAFNLEYINYSERDLRQWVIAKTKSSYSNRSRTNYDAFTILAVENMTCKFVKENKAIIPKLINILENKEMIAQIGKYKSYNVYCLIKQQ